MRLVSKIRDKCRFWVNHARYDFKNTRPPEELSFAQLRHVVVSKMDGKLGDSQVMTPFFTELKKYFPQVRISVLCSANVAPIYWDCLKLDGVFVVKKRPSRQELEQVVAQIAGFAPCDLLITLEGYFRFQDFYLAHLLHPSFVAGIAEGVDCININLEQRNPQAHITAFFTDLLHLGGVKDPDMTYLPLVTEETLKTVSAYCRAPQLAFAPWGASVHKHLADDLIVAVAKLLLEKTPANLALLVPPEGNYLKERLAWMQPAERLICVPERMDCLELASIIHRSAALITVDTGNLHLACASGLPLFAIYNGNNSVLNLRWAPLSRNPLTEKFEKQGLMIDELKEQDLLPALQDFLNRLQFD